MDRQSIVRSSWELVIVSPAIRAVSTRAVIARSAAEGLLAPGQAEILASAHRLFIDATQLMRLSIDGPFDPARAAGGVKRRIAAAAGLPDFEALADAMAEARGQGAAGFSGGGGDEN